MMVDIDTFMGRFILLSWLYIGRFTELVEDFGAKVSKYCSINKYMNIVLQ